jgi:hypothetical protein
MANSLTSYVRRLRPRKLAASAQEVATRWPIPFEKQRIAHLLAFKRLLDQVRDREGVVVECGLGSLRTFRTLAILIEVDGPPRELWGFDSFQGYPMPGEHDFSEHLGLSPKDGRQEPRMTVEAARELMSNTVSNTAVRIVPGFFKDTLPKTRVPEIAFLHLDVVLYESYKISLEHLFPQVVEGGIVLFDEYDDANFKTYPGARRAVDEYLNDKGYEIRTDRPSGLCFVVKTH